MSILKSNFNVAVFNKIILHGVVSNLERIVFQIELYLKNRELVLGAGG